jgi:hypothetical protein
MALIGLGMVAAAGCRGEGGSGHRAAETAPVAPVYDAAAPAAAPVAEPAAEPAEGEPTERMPPVELPPERGGDVEVPELILEE